LQRTPLRGAAERDRSADEKRDTTVDIAGAPKIAAITFWRTSVNLRVTVPLLGTLGILGAACATVHQSPAMDPGKLRDYTGAKVPAGALTSQDSHYETVLSIHECVQKILEACYELDIPVFTPLISADQHSARLTSGVFLAKCGLDCKCSDQGVRGHGADTASGIVSVDLASGSDKTTVHIRSMFWRTEAGPYGATANVYFDSLGRIERRILDEIDVQ
jgi:hypothetical protein